MKIFGPEFIANPIVSVILCAINREDTVVQAIYSILEQKCNFPFEIIIGEDCGTDKTRQICIDYQKRYPSKIKLLLHKENCGLGKNWAILVKEARGKYIASCDDDDYWHNPFKLQMQVEYMETHAYCGMVHTEKDVLDLRKNKLIPNYNQKLKINIPQGSIMKEIFSGKVPICVSSTLTRKELIDKYVPLDDYIRYKYHIQDWQTWIILSKYSKIDYIPISTTTYRIGYESISNPIQYQKIEERFAIEKGMYEKLCSMFPEDLNYSETGYQSYVKGLLLKLAYKKSDYIAAKKYSLQMIEYGNKNLKAILAQNWITFKLYALCQSLRRY